MWCKMLEIVFKKTNGKSERRPSYRRNCEKGKKKNVQERNVEANIFCIFHCNAFRWPVQHFFVGKQ